jgi:hypothetical protein
MKKISEIRKCDLYIFSGIIHSHLKSFQTPKKRRIIRRMSIYYEII